MSDQEAKQVPVEETSEAEPPVSVGRMLLDSLRLLMWIAPFIIVLVIVVLALLGPSVGNVFSNIVPIM